MLAATRTHNQPWAIVLLPGRKIAMAMRW